MKSSTLSRTNKQVNKPPEEAAVEVDREEAIMLDVEREEVAEAVVVVEEVEDAATETRARLKSQKEEIRQAISKRLSRRHQAILGCREHHSRSDSRT